MRKHKLTLKTMINFRFCFFKNMANRTNIYERIYVSCHVGKPIAQSRFADYISILSELQRNTADIQGFWMDYHDKILFLQRKNDKKERND